MESKSREQFDQYLKSQHLKPVGWIRDEYWKIWQASRSALVVEIPESFEVEMGAYGDAKVVSVAEIIESIRAAGTTVKGEGDD